MISYDIDLGLKELYTLKNFSFDIVNNGFQLSIKDWDDMYRLAFEYFLLVLFSIFMCTSFSSTPNTVIYDGLIVKFLDLNKSVGISSMSFVIWSVTKEK